MKPIVMRTFSKPTLLTGFVFLSACFGYCTNGLADAQCVLLPANAATDIRSTVDTREPDVRERSLPPGWRVSYSLFEGDYFSVTLPASSSDGPGREPEPTDSSRLSADPGQQNARAVVKAIVTHMGFHDPTGGRVLSNEFLGVEPYKMHIGGGDILEVARINCGTGQHADPENPTSFCGLDEGQQKQLIERATGMAADDYLDRRLTRYYFFQRPQHREWPGRGASTVELCSHYPGWQRNCLNAVIEHSAIAATLRSDNTVATVTGRVFSKYRVTNEPKLPASKAVAVAYEQLWEVPGISRYEDQPDTIQKLPLVLLPYTHPESDERSHSPQSPNDQRPQLKYAYRTTLWGNYVDEVGRHVEAASWRAWVDAETGDVLQLIPQFEFAEVVEAKGKGWHLHPSPPVGADDLPTERSFKVDGLGSGPPDCQCPDDVDPSGQYCLKLAGVFDQIEFVQFLYNGQQESPKFLCSPATNFAAGLDCATTPWDCLCLTGDDLKSVHYLGMNAYAHVFAYKEKLDKAICSSANGTPENISSICVDGLFQAVANEGSVGHVPLRLKVGGDSLGIYEAAPGSPHLVFGDIDEVFLGDIDEVLLSHCDQVGTGAGERPGA